MIQTSRQATLLINPAARGAPHFDAVAALRRLRQHDVTPRLVISRDPAHALEVARTSVDSGDDLLFVVGGDGSARAIAPVLAGTSTALAMLRGGTANVWAKEVDIPAGLAGIDSHLAGQVAAMDLGYCNHEPFLLMAGIGWDAAITAHVDPRLKTRIGPAAYVLEALREVPRLRGQPIAMSIDGRPLNERVAMVLLSNTRLYGGVARLNPGALATDGLLDVMVAAPSGVLDTLNAAVRLAIPAFDDGPGVTRFLAATVEVSTPGLPIQLDGDPCGATPASFRVDRAALRVSVPAGPLPAVLGG
jgi:YegS/Rv2252/BmrU family lipid kinase